MSTTYSTSTKDKDATDTYVRDTTTDTTTGKSGKNKSGTTTETDKTHEIDNIGSQYGKTTGQTGQQYGTSGSQYTNQQTRGQQYGQDTSPHGQQCQQDVQQKLKEVGNLLQRAGHILQDLQGSSGEFQWSTSRGPSGNFGGPYGGYDSHHSGPYSGPGHCGPNSRYECERDSRGPSYRRYDADFDREERGFPARGGFSRPESERFESRQDRGNVDRFGGFGGPNRPDLAYGQQYGAHPSSEGRRGPDFESRRAGDRLW